jgi:hypothetical protein
MLILYVSYSLGCAILRLPKHGNCKDPMIMHWITDLNSFNPISSGYCDRKRLIYLSYMLLNCC